MEEIEQNYNHVIETLTSTFGNVLSRDVFLAIIENCGGDLEQSANAIMNIVIEGNTLSPNGPQNIDDYSNESEQSASAPNVSTSQDNIPTNSTMTSYALASQSSKPTIQLIPKPTMTSTDIIWTTQLRQISAHHENGARTLIIMRGAPGSGKTHLAKQLLNNMLGSQLEKNYYIHILSTDDYFMYRGIYLYDKCKLSDAHEWNRNRATQAMRQGISPVIIDNTNIQYFEMEGYVREGVKNGYIIEVVEPNTAWAKKAMQLFKRNSHGVPIHTIRRILENYENGITGTLLMKKFNCYYTHQMLPPVLRNMPPIPQKSHKEVSSAAVTKQCKDINSNSVKVKQTTEIKMSPSTLMMEANALISQESNTLCDEEVDSNQKIRNINDKFVETQKCLEEMEKVGIEWDNGDDWDDSRNNISEKYDDKILPESKFNSKPQRRNKSPRSVATEKLIPFVKDCQDWNKISELPPWDDRNSVPVVEKDTAVLEKTSCGTCIEKSDLSTLSLNNSLKIIRSTPRNINESYVALKTNKMPEKWLLDKSTSTSDEILPNNHRCPNEAQHFKALRKLFKNIARSDLRHIFDGCCGDVNWAVAIIMDGIKVKKFGFIEKEDSSDTEEEIQNEIECQCLSAYGIQPYISEQSKYTVESENGIAVSSPSYNLKKVKKKIVVSEASKELKRQIEENFVIPSSHNSQNSLKIRNFQPGDDETLKIIMTEHISPKNYENLLVVNQLPSTSQYQDSQTDCNMPSTSKSDNNEISDEDSYAGWDETESTVNVNLGTEFIAQLDKLFGRNMEYPKNVNPRINMPKSLLNEINALWMESLMYQLEEDAKQSELMIQQDEEFARELAIKEAELSRAGKEPVVPDFKEIMDMDFAVSLYQKDVAECLNNKPLDMAGKLSREKLYNLFPDILPSVLSELLAAHEEDFQATVEVLLMSTGKVDIIDGQNGINKFIMTRELERHQEKLLEEEKKTLCEVEWPLLPKWEKVEMSVVEQYRKEGEKHLHARNINYQKAQEYIRRGMTPVACYYSDVAAFHKRKYEQANSLAAASLMQVHASNNSDNATIDLHYLRVPEAIESVDLFLDTHIQTLREVQDNNIVKYHTLYFITGRGLHSSGGPRIKPAVKKRLLERGLVFSERNPGLLTAKVSANDRMSYQLA